MPSDFDMAQIKRDKMYKNFGDNHHGIYTMPVTNNSIYDRFCNRLQ